MGEMSDTSSRHDVHDMDHPGSVPRHLLHSPSEVGPQVSPWVEVGLQFCSGLMPGSCKAYLPKVGVCPALRSEQRTPRFKAVHPTPTHPPLTLTLVKAPTPTSEGLPNRDPQASAFCSSNPIMCQCLRRLHRVGQAREIVQGQCTGLACKRFHSQVPFPAPPMPELSVVLNRTRPGVGLGSVCCGDVGSGVLEESLPSHR